MIIYTSYFGNLKRLGKAGVTPIGIAIRPPSWFSGQTLFDLTPTQQMVKGIKNGKLTWKRYEKLYWDVLKKSDPKKLLKHLEGIYNGRDIALLCYEKDRKECHRDMTARWIEHFTGVEVKEFPQPEEKKPPVKKNQLSLFKNASKV